MHLTPQSAGRHPLTAHSPVPPPGWVPSAGATEARVFGWASGDPCKRALPRASSQGGSLPRGCWLAPPGLLTHSRQWPPAEGRDPISKRFQRFTQRYGDTQNPSSTACMSRAGCPCIRLGLFGYQNCWRPDNYLCMSSSDNQGGVGRWTRERPVNVNIDDGPGCSRPNHQCSGIGTGWGSAEPSQSPQPSGWEWSN
jgi:hypothetical protein